MILPIIAYGNPVLRKKCNDIEPSHEGLETLIANMWETMYNARGVGLAAPQIGKDIRLFIVDTIQLEDDETEAEEEAMDEKGIKKVFINAVILREEGEPWPYEEGCLSIPEIREKVTRKGEIRIRYYNEEFELKEDRYDGMNARVIQHEYDHIEGILFTDHLKPLKKRLLKRKLENISKGKIKVAYKMNFPLAKGVM